MQNKPRAQPYRISHPNHLRDPPLALRHACFFRISQSVNKGSGVENLHFLGDGLFGTKQLD